MNKSILVLSFLLVIAGCTKRDMCQFGRYAEEEIACREKVELEETKLRELNQPPKNCPPEGSPGFCATSHCCPYPPNWCKALNQKAAAIPLELQQLSKLQDVLPCVTDDSCLSDDVDFDFSRVSKLSFNRGGDGACQGAGL